MYHPSHPKSAIADSAPDVKEPGRALRTGRTRRGFLLAGLALALGAITVPFVPGRKSKLDPTILFDLEPATANKKWLKDLCLNFYRHPDPEIRFQCARCMMVLPQDPPVKNALWHMIRRDASLRNREQAAQSLICHIDTGDHAAIAAEYHQRPSLRPAINRMIRRLDYTELEATIRAFGSR